MEGPIFVDCGRSARRQFESDGAVALNLHRIKLYEPFYAPRSRHNPGQRPVERSAECDNRGAPSWRTVPTLRTLQES